jgi:signal transduction histidine kinase
LLRYKDGKFTRFTPAEGLPSDVICQILDDGKGNLWMGSHRGIFSVSKTGLDEFARGKTTTLDCSIYGMSDGLPTLECSGGYQPSAWRSRDDRLWFTTYRGVVSIKPFEIPTNSLPPPVVLESVSVDGKPVAAGLDAKGKDSATNSTLSGTQSTPELQILPGKHYFEFRYTGLSFLAPDQVRFRHRLDGLEDAWVEAGTRRDAHYSHLPPGKYKFLVSACNNDGVWNQQGDSLAFSVLPYFYETRWFRALMVVVAVVFVAGTVRFIVMRRMRRELELLERKRAVERDRSRIAQDIHDELGAGLTQVLLQSSIASREASGQTQTDLNQISENTRELVRKMDEIVWAVTPEKDKLDSLVTYVGKFVQEFCAAVQIRCRLDLPAQLPDIAVSTEVRHGLFLAVKEAMNNIAKHASATEASIQLKLRPDAFTFIIRDDGVGLGTSSSHDQDRLFSGRGMQNITQRLEKIGGVCVVSAAPGKGTQVELTVRLNYKN